MRAPSRYEVLFIWQVVTERFTLWRDSIFSGPIKS